MDFSIAKAYERLVEFTFRARSAKNIMVLTCQRNCSFNLVSGDGTDTAVCNEKGTAEPSTSFNGWLYSLSSMESWSVQYINNYMQWSIQWLGGSYGAMAIHIPCDMRSISELPRVFQPHTSGI